MLLPVLAGLGALSLMSNPRRRRRRAKAQRNPRGRALSDVTPYTGPALPRFMQNATPAQREAVIKWYTTLPLSNLRRRQDVTYQQIEMAYKQRLDRELSHMQMVSKLLAEAVDRKSFPSKKRSNPAMPGGVDARGTRYKLKRKAETREWVLVAYVNGKRHEGRTLYFDDRKDAEDTLRHITGTQTNPKQRYMVGHGGRPIVSRAKAKKIAAEFGFTKLPRPGYETFLFKYGRYDNAVYLSNIAGTFVISDIGAISEPISSEVASKLGIRTNPRRGRRNPPTLISRASLTDAEKAIHGRAMLGSKRSGAWAMSKSSAESFARRLRHGFRVERSGAVGALKEPLYLVTDGHWYVG